MCRKGIRPRPGTVVAQQLSRRRFPYVTMVFMSDEPGPQSRAFDAALSNLTIEARDKAAVELARRYSRLIDESAPASKYREPLLMISQALPKDEPIELAFRKIVDALAEHSVMSDLGPKLLAVLTSLGMTPAGRKTKIADDGEQRPKGPADDLRAKREQREQRRRDSGNPG